MGSKSYNVLRDIYDKKSGVPVKNSMQEMGCWILLMGEEGPGKTTRKKCSV